MTGAVSLFEIGERVRAPADNIVLQPGDTRIFDDPDSVWFIREGIVDLFAVQRRDGRQTGPRDHLCSLVAGGLLWGIDQSGEENGIHLLALSVGQTHLTRIDVRLLEEWSAKEALAALLARSLDMWIAGLSLGVTKHITPRQPARVALMPGEQIVVAEGDRVVSHKTVTWAELLDGTACYIDIKEIGPMDPTASKPTLAPMTGRAWIRIATARRVRGHSTQEVLQKGPVAPHMDAFHRSVFHNLAYGFRNAAAMERGRLKRQSSQLVNDTEDALFRLARIFTPHLTRRRESDADNALFDCCAAVGHALHVTMTMPPSARRRRSDESPLTVADVADASRLRVRQVTLRGNWWMAENGPLVANRQADGSPVALLQKTPSVMVLHDPVTGGEEVVTAEIAATLSPTAYCFYVGLPDHAVGLWDILRLCLKHCRPDLAMVGLTGILGGLIATAIPLATGYVFDTVIPGHQTAQMIQVAIAIAVSALAAAAFEYTRAVSLLRVEGRLSGILQSAIMDRLLRLPATFFANYSSGDLSQRAMMVESIRKSLSGAVLNALVSGAFSVFGLLLLFYYAPIAAAAACLIFALMAALTILSGLRLMQALASAQEVSGRLSSLVFELISGVTKLRMAGAEERAFNKWARDVGDLRLRQNVARGIQYRFVAFWGVYEILALAAIFAVLAGTRQGNLTTGSLLAFISAFDSLLISFFGLSQSVILLFASAPLYRRAMPILAARPENDQSKADPGTLTGEIEINNLVFRYGPGMPEVLRGLSMSINAGELIAIVGPSGSGKSTLMRLLLGLDRPESGAVYYDGKDLLGLNKRAVRRQIGVVLQNGRLLPGTIYENIRGATNASADECMAAAERVGLAADIDAMPMQMHTLITEGSSGLSGGQVQRLLIARALVGRPSILLLDEATSALDNRTQAIVMNSLQRLSVTRIVIAHRLSTIMNADRIYVLRQGQVVEDGTYAELVGRGGVFTALAHRQQL